MLQFEKEALQGLMDGEKALMCCREARQRRSTKQGKEIDAGDKGW